MDPLPLWGIDLGGTKIEGVVLPDAQSDQPICRVRIPTEAEHGYAHIVERVCLMVAMLESESERKCSILGLGGPGTPDPQTGLMKGCNTTCLNDRPLPTDLKSALDREVLVANDANCFSLAEADLGAAKGATNVFGVILGTGVGGGIVINGRVVSGAQGIAGEWGHNVLEPNGAPCYCGKKGCVETVLSGPALERYYHGLTGIKRRLPMIIEAARNGEPEAQATLDRLTDKFGEAISVVVDVLDPEVIVVGGGVGNIDELYKDGVESLRNWVFNPRLDTKVVRPKLGDSAGVFGAAHLTRLTGRPTY